MESGAADIELSVDDARHQARHELALAGKQGSLNRDQAAISEMPTLDEWYQEFKVKNPRRFVETTVRDNTTRMAQYISPRLGKTPLHKITGGDLEDLVLELEKDVGARTANMSKRLVGQLLDWANKRGLMPENWVKPTCESAQENPTREDNHIPASKAAQFAEAVERLRTRPIYFHGEGDTAADIIWMAVFTGGRKNNVLKMAWSEIDTDQLVWKIPASKYKTRKKTNRGANIPLIHPAVALLEKRRACCGDSPWVFPSHQDITKPVDNINKSWDWVRRESGLANITFHGLRHTLGTWQGHLGINQKMIAASLGQQDLASTERYVHADTEVIRANMDRAITTSFEIVTDERVPVALSLENWQLVIDEISDKELAMLIRDQL